MNEEELELEAAQALLEKTAHAVGVTSGDRGELIFGIQKAITTLEGVLDHCIRKFAPKTAPEPEESPELLSREVIEEADRKFKKIRKAKGLPDERAPGLK